MVRTLQRFRDCERGTATLEFVLVFPIFFAFFLMVFESGMVSLRHVMLERGMDVTVREVRIGALVEPTKDELVARICEVAQIIPDCAAELQLEMMIKNPRNFTALTGQVPCIDRSVVVQVPTTYQNVTHNDLVVLRACLRLDPYLPTTGLGKAIVDGGTLASGGSYALISTAAFVVEPEGSDGDDGSGGGATTDGGAVSDDT